MVERGKNERSSASICILNSFLLCFKSFCFDQFLVSYIGGYPHTAWVDFLQADGKIMKTRINQSCISGDDNASV